MAPIILGLQQASWARVRVVATAQHRQLLDKVLSFFDIEPNIDLDAMRPDQALPDLTAKLLTELDRCFAQEAPDAVLAQGDTTTVMVSALAAFYRKIPFGHVEAGLRSGDVLSPFPEEMNRILASNLARWHFAPTESARTNLLAEAIPADSIFVTGNTVIDALLDVSSRCDADTPDLPSDKRLILVTAHRRENFGKPFAQICRAIRYLADLREDVIFLYPVHPNPHVKDAAYCILGGHPRIRLCEPLDYVPFVAAMKRASFILSDSGGVQEEAPALGKPVLVLRRETERPEAVAEGVVRLVGPDFDAIVRESQRLLDDPRAYGSMARGVSPYGDGHSAGRIVAVLGRSVAE